MLFVFIPMCVYVCAVSGFYLLGEAGGKLPPLTAQLPPQMVSTYYIRLAF